MTCSEGMGSVEATISLSNPRQPRLHVADDRVMQVPCVARSGWPIRLIVFCGSFGGGWLRTLGRGSAGSHAADFWRENRRVGEKRPAKEGLAHDKTVALKAANASCSQGQTRNSPPKHLESKITRIFRVHFTLNETLRRCDCRHDRSHHGKRQRGHNNIYV